jgi:hypothetical protein
MAPSRRVTSLISNFEFAHKFVQPPSRLFGRRFVSDVGGSPNDVRHCVNVALRAGDGHAADIEAAMIDAPMLSGRRDVAAPPGVSSCQAAAADRWEAALGGRIPPAATPRRLIQSQFAWPSKVPAAPIVKLRGYVLFFLLNLNLNLNRNLF